MRTAVVIPVKSFTTAKGRLAEILSPVERESLARLCAEVVIAAGAPLPVYVACSDPDVAAWAHAQGARVVHCPTPGLDNAVAIARTTLLAEGFEHIVVAHGDLPVAEKLEHIAQKGKVTMVADRHRDGTNVLAFPIDSPFHTAYGPGSLDNHIHIAQNANMEYELIEDESLQLDLDTADDLSELNIRQRKQ